VRGDPPRKCPSRQNMYNFHAKFLKYSSENNVYAIKFHKKNVGYIHAYYKYLSLYKRFKPTR